MVITMDHGHPCPEVMDDLKIVLLDEERPTPMVEIGQEMMEET